MARPTELAIDWEAKNVSTAVYCRSQVQGHGGTAMLVSVPAGTDEARLWHPDYLAGLPVVGKSSLECGWTGQLYLGDARSSKVCHARRRLAKARLSPPTPSTSLTEPIIA